MGIFWTKKDTESLIFLHHMGAASLDQSKDVLYNLLSLARSIQGKSNISPPMRSTNRKKFPAVFSGFKAL
jgi:hypothetical protein